MGIKTPFIGRDISEDFRQKVNNMAGRNEIIEGAYSLEAVNDSRDGYKPMTIQEFKDVFNVKWDRWLRGEEAVVRNASYRGRYSLLNEQLEYAPKMHIWLVGSFWSERFPRAAPVLLKIKTHCWDENKLGNPRTAFVDGGYRVTADGYGNVTEISRIGD